MKTKIGIFDSGIGGFSILTELKKRLPNEDFIYFADNKNNPYGDKTTEALCLITSQIVERLKKEGCKIIVIACNTATTVCMRYLKEKYKEIIFVGTVPAIKVAFDKNYKNILVLSTKATASSKRVNELIINNIKKDTSIWVQPCVGLAELIEKKDNDKTNKLLKKLLTKYKEKQIDAIVLGCTHYSFIKEMIHNHLPNAKIFDGAIGVSKEVKRQLEQNGLKVQEKTPGEITIIES